MIPKRRGYVLVTSLALLVLSATLLISMGRTAIDRTMHARDSQAELQRRWGQISCRRAILPFAETILTQVERREQRPVAIHHAIIQLGPQEFHLIIGDEQAKANINALLDLTDKDRAESQIRGALPGAGLSAQIRLRPSLIPATFPTTRAAILPRLITSFGQILDSTAPQNLLASHGSSPAPAELLTMWGDGTMNIRRASAASLALLDSPPLTQIDIRRVLEVRNKLYLPGQNAPQAMGAALPTDPIRGLLAQANIATNKANLHLTMGSRCHSLWIIVRDGRREWYSLEVLDRTEKDRPMSQSFVW
jgi:hypothetical protein